MTPTAVLVTPPVEEPLTRAQGKLRAGLDWPDGDERDELMDNWIAAARSQVETDTGHALLTQTWDVSFDGLGTFVSLPLRPLQSVTTLALIDTAGAAIPFDPLLYYFDLPGSRLLLVPPFETTVARRWAARIVVGWPSRAALLAAAPGLVQAVGILTAHFATFGRDLLQVGHILEVTPFGYEDAIRPYRQVTLA